MRTAPERVLLVAAFGAFLAFLDATVVNVAFPDIRESFSGASVGDLSWVLNAYNIVFGSFLVVFGRLTDLLGRRRMFVVGTLVFTLASVLCAVAPTLGMLIAFRVLQALGAALLVPASLAVVVEAFPADRRSHAVGLWGASAAVAAGLGPPVGGALVEVGGWRLAFLVNLPIGIAAIFVIRRTLVESRAPGRRKMPDLVGALLLAGGLAALTTVIIQGNEWGWISLPVLAFAVVALLLVGGFLASSARHPQPMLDPALLRIRAFSVGNLTTLVAGMGFYAYMLTNILWVQYVWGYDILRAGAALVPGAVVAAIAAAVLGEVAQKHGYRRIIVPGALIWCAAYLWYALVVDVEPAFLSQWLPGQVLSGLGVGATLPLLTSAALTVVPGGRYATASAVLSSTRQLGGVLGIALLVVILGTPTPGAAEGVLRDGWVFCAVCFGACTIGGLLLGRVDAQAELAEPTGKSGALHLPEQRGAEAAQLLRPAVRVGSFLERLPGDVRAEFEAAGKRRTLQGGAWLFREGDTGDSMFVVVSGRLEVVVGGRVVRELGAGAVLGELALLTGGRPRSASVRARRDSELIEVDREAFFTELRRGPDAPIALATALAEELRSAVPEPELTSTTPTLVAVVGLHAGAPVDEVALTLESGLSRDLRVAVTHAATPEQLERMERDHDRVLLVAGDPGHPWWQACVRQSDRVVAVASSSAQPVGWSGPTGADLVLVGRPPGSDVVKAWSEALTPWQMTFAESVDATTLRPLVARLAGKALGLVLAGGGARALTHIGVLRELEDAGLHVDRVVGTSLGAVVAAGWASGLDGAGLEDLHYEQFVRGNPVTDYTFPSKALTKGRRTPEALQRSYGKDSLIEALPRQFRCVSVDLYGRAPVVHRRGVLWEAVTASCRLPILYPPWQSDGTLLVDGCVLDNLPVPVLQERNEGPIVAVNIGAGEKPARREGAPVRVPPLGDTLLRVMTIGGEGTTQRAVQLGAFVITPPSMGVGIMEYHQLDTMVEAGRRAARALLKATGGDLSSAAQAQAELQPSTSSGLRDGGPE